jgi:luciferase family oxidoreductase group 1
MSLKFSVLDLCPIPAGQTATDAIANSADLARKVEAAGYHRYWLAEHHNSGMLACSTPELLICKVAGATTRLRVGSGGVMLPNHAALKVAESFRVLEAMYPGRIDLGLGRAPGTDPVTASALRRGRHDADDFPQQLSDLVGYLKDALPDGHPHARVAATPMGVPCPPIWILGSSLYGARVAAVNGFGFAYAHHIVPENAHAAMRLYHEEFHASPFGFEPRAILAVSAVCAPTQDEAELLASTADLSMMRTRTGRTRFALPSVEEATSYVYTPDEEDLRRYNRTRIHIGTPESLRESIGSLARATQANEVMINSQIHRHADRVRSYGLLASALAD